jgi:hypothetical protein
MDAASDALLVRMLDDSVVILCAKEELNVTLVVLEVVMDAASDALLPEIVDDSEVMLCARDELNVVLVVFV